MQIEKLVKRKTQAQARNFDIRNTLQECYKYAMPEKAIYFDDNSGTKLKPRTDVFDSTIAIAVEKYANRLQNQLVPTGKTWSLFKTGSEFPDEMTEQIQLQLDEANDILFNHIRHSNFPLAVNEAFMDVSVSIGALIIEEGDGIQSNLHFRAVPPSELAFEQTIDGIIETVFRDFKMTPRQIMAQYPNGDLGQKLTQLLADAPDVPVQISEAIIYNAKNDYTHTVFFEDDKQVIYQENIESSPYVIFRESVLSGETFGFGRVMRLLPEIKTLNKAQEFALRTDALRSAPPVTVVDDGVVNVDTYVIKPNSFLPVSSNDSSAPSMRFMDVPSRNEPIMMIQERQNLINEYMLANPFGNIHETPVRTATEMSIRNADLQQTSNSALSRFQVELLESIIKRCVYILKKSGELPDLKIDGKEVTLKFTSPMALQQDREETAKLMDFLGTMQQTELPPEQLMGAIKFEQFPKYLAEMLGIPQKLIRTQAEMQQMAQAQQQAAMQQQGEMVE